jgi:hypothetical protein
MTIQCKFDGGKNSADLPQYPGWARMLAWSAVFAFGAAIWFVVLA